MIIEAKEAPVLVESKEGYNGVVLDIAFNGVSILPNDPLYKEIMEVPHMLSGLMACEAGTAMNAVAVFIELFGGFTCDGDISMPYSKDVIY